MPSPSPPAQSRRHAFRKQVGIAGPEHQDQIAGLGAAYNRFAGLREIWAAVSPVADRGRQGGRIDLIFPVPPRGRINVANSDLVGRRQGLGERLKKERRSRSQMGLEYHPDPVGFRFQTPGGCDRGADFGRMMGVVVDQAYPGRRV